LLGGAGIFEQRGDVEQKRDCRSDGKEPVWLSCSFAWAGVMQLAFACDFCVRIRAGRTRACASMRARVRVCARAFKAPDDCVGVGGCVELVERTHLDDEAGRIDPGPGPVQTPHELGSREWVFDALYEWLFFTF
jgi:hypothetical protein